jgi:hypothetical protein
MKAAIFFALLAVAYAGTSSQFRSQDGVGNYNFGYDEAHSTGGTFRRESGNGAGQVVGSYGLSDADGRRRIVNYVADAAGYRASISTNEPGTEAKDPAHTSINKAVIAVAPAPATLVAHAPAVHIASPAAPIAIAAPTLSSYTTAVNHGAAVVAHHWGAPALANGWAGHAVAPVHAPWGYNFAI